MSSLIQSFAWKFIAKELLSLFDIQQIYRAFQLFITLIWTNCHQLEQCLYVCVLSICMSTLKLPSVIFSRIKAAEWLTEGDISSRWRRTISPRILINFFVAFTLINYFLINSPNHSLQAPEILYKLSRKTRLANCPLISCHTNWNNYKK